MIDHLLTQPATITRRTDSGSKDAYGNPIPTETTASTVGFAQQDAETDDRVDADRAELMWWVFLPPGTAIDRTDRITIAGETLEVVELRSPTRPGPETHHVEARCRVVRG